MKVVKRGNGEFIDVYQPKKFEELIDTFGIQSFLKIIQSPDRPRKYLFKGARGAGKTTLANIFTKWLNSSINEGEYGTEPDLESDTSKVIDSGCLDFMKINVADKRKLEDVRELVASIRYNPSMLKYRVVMLDEFHQMTPDAMEVLLAETDKVNDKTIFIFCTMNPEKIHKALLDRITGTFTFRELTIEQKFDFMIKVLDNENFRYVEDDVRTIAKNCGNSPRKILKTIQLYMNGAIDVAAEVEKEKQMYDLGNKILDGDISVMKDIVNCSMIKEEQSPEGLRVALATFFKNKMIGNALPEHIHKYSKCLNRFTEPYYGSDIINRLTLNIYLAVKDNMTEETTIEPVRRRVPVA